MRDYERYLMGTWVEETERDRQLRELAETYHQGNEAYDQRVCSGISPRTGEAIPLTPYEMKLVNRHALTMRDTLILEGEHLGFTQDQVIAAIKDYWK